MFEEMAVYLVVNLRNYAVGVNGKSDVAGIRKTRNQAN
jgi:hypothetical protein